jgi:ABC-type dipeptide/oligopeptide/nickel transport system permease subunit
MKYIIIYFIIGYVLGLYATYKRGYKYQVPEMIGIEMLFLWPFIIIFVLPFTIAYEKSKHK